MISKLKLASARCADRDGGAARADGRDVIEPTGATLVWVATKPVDSRSVMRQSGPTQPSFERYGLRASAVSALSRSQRR